MKTHNWTTGLGQIGIALVLVLIGVNMDNSVGTVYTFVTAIPIFLLFVIGMQNILFTGSKR